VSGPTLPPPPPAAPPGRRLRAEELGWGIASLVVNVLVLIGIGFLIPVFRRVADAYRVPGNYRLIFHVVAALTMVHALWRIVLQWIRLRRPVQEEDDDEA
jgi:hypothetical protein